MPAEPPGLSPALDSMVGFGPGGEVTKQCCPNSLSLKEPMADGNVKECPLWGLGQPDTHPPCPEEGAPSREVSVRRSQDPNIASPHVLTHAVPEQLGLTPLGQQVQAQCCSTPVHLGPELLTPRSALWTHGSPSTGSPHRGSGHSHLFLEGGAQTWPLLTTDMGRPGGPPSPQKPVARARKGPRPTGSTGPGGEEPEQKQRKELAGCSTCRTSQGPGGGVSEGGSGRWQHHQPGQAHRPQRRAQHPDSSGRPGHTAQHRTAWRAGMC